MKRLSVFRKADERQSAPTLRMVIEVFGWRLSGMLRPELQTVIAGHLAVTPALHLLYRRIQ
jgi:hypothetical protein